MHRFCRDYRSYINFLWMTLLLLQVLRYGEPQSTCVTPDARLALKFDTGYIHPEGHPYDISGNQHCEWTFPHEKFKDRGLFIYIDKIDMVSRNDETQTRKVVGDVRLAGNSFTSTPRANCRFYGKNITDVDIKRLTAHVEVMQKKFPSRLCLAWYFDQEMLDKVVFRTYGGITNDELYGKTFYLRYQFVDVGISTPTTAGANGQTPITATAATTTKSDAHSQATKAQICTETTTETLALAIACVVLIASNFLVGFFLCRKYQFDRKPHIKSRQTHISTLSDQPQINNASYAMVADTAVAYASVPTHAYLNQTCTDPSPYSMVPEQDVESLNQVTYDVPPNNRLRTPTVNSSQSTASEIHYLTPSSLPVVEEVSEEQESPQSEQVKDLYAVVKKKTK